MRILVTGREGQVVTALVERGALHPDIVIEPLGRPDLDLADTAAIAAAIVAARPDVIVSAAAYTAVDLAETETATAHAVNALAPGEIGKAAAHLGVPVVHLSTDYVFDGSKAAPYEETDPVAPLGVYGATKREGEVALAAATADHAILRTAWVYSPFGKNFLKTMLRVAMTRDHLTVVDDQVGNPTSALDIADAVITVARNLATRSDPDLRGVFHMTGSGEASWADFAVEIFDVSRAAHGPSAEVKRIPTRDYPTPAKRPANSRLDCSRLARIHGVTLPDWKISTAAVVRRALDAAQS
ncbi:dTDP-4-dehydrorhamnose reductase [Ensifer soli]|uniref:dTDP-4-dehydrorhamnose reductase n=1 Tax=Ciceribacter sp. sgz301302 TaxID=3342379 RepID=UPI0035BA63C5